MIAIDILYLVDRLEALLRKGTRVPMTTKTMVDEDELLDIIDQMRIAVPEEIKVAKKFQQDRERMLAEAQEEVAQIVSAAKADADRMVSDNSIILAAEQKAEQIEEQARAEAESIKQGADAYATQVLTDIQARLEQLAEQIAALQTEVYNGVTYITEHHANPEVESTVEETVS